MSGLPASEFSRRIALRQIVDHPLTLEATEDERAALAERFSVSRIDRLEARIALDRDGDRVGAQGTLDADIVQPCAVSGEDFPVIVAERVAFRFVPEGSITPDPVPGEEIEVELDEGELDDIEYAGDGFDLGEAVAQSLALAIDPYAVGPQAQATRERAGITHDDEAAPSGPLAEKLGAALKGK